MNIPLRQLVSFLIYFLHLLATKEFNTTKSLQFKLSLVTLLWPFL